MKEHELKNWWHTSICVATMALAVAGYQFGELKSWAAVGLYCFGLLGLLGTKRFEGLHISPEGVSVEEPESTDQEDVK